MKLTLLLLRSSIYVVLIILITSCETSNDFDVLAPVVPIDSQNYLPVAIGNQWSYKNSQGLQNDVSVTNVLETQEEKFFELTAFGMDRTWIRKSESFYYLRLQKHDDSNFFYNQSYTGYGMLFFNHNAEVGEYWESTTFYTISYEPIGTVAAKPSEDIAVGIKTEMLRRDMIKTIDGITYNNVMEISLSLTEGGSTSVSNYLIAEGIGIIEHSAGIETTKLSSYNFVN